MCLRGDICFGRNTKEELMRRLMAVTLLAMLLISCSGNDGAEQGGADSLETSAEPDKVLRLSEKPDQAAGISWNLPIDWKQVASSGMSVAGYLIPAARSDTADATCTCFFFGSGQGGDVEANVKRWLSQVTQPDGSPTLARMKRSEIELDCCRITIVDIPGTYHAAGMGGGGARDGWVILGAIVEAPEGNVFFKLTGPEATVYANRAQFVGMLESIWAVD
jgi:hypothetical protein